MSVGLTRDVTVELRDWERRDRKTSRLDPTRTGRFTLTDADTATRLADWTAGQTAAMTELLVRPPPFGPALDFIQFGMAYAAGGHPNKNLARHG